MNRFGYLDWKDTNKYTSPSDILKLFLSLLIHFDQIQKFIEQMLVLAYVNYGAETWYSHILHFPKYANSLAMQVKYILLYVFTIQTIIKCT